MKLSVVMPVYNEAGRSARSSRGPRGPIDKEILIVDDGSTDGTRDILRRASTTRRRAGVRSSRHNQGKGAALRAAFAEATRRRRRDPGRRPRVRPARVSRGCCSRSSTARPTSSTARASSAAQPHRVLYFWHSVGNRVLTLAVEHVHRPEPHRHGDLLQGVPARGDPVAHARGGPLRHRARDHRQGRAARAGASTRSAISYGGRTYDRGQEDRLEGRVLGAVDDRPARRARDRRTPKNVGHVTLARMAKLEPYNRWLVEPRSGSARAAVILEIGAGFGNMTRHLRRRRELVVASDLDRRRARVPDVGRSARPGRPRRVATAFRSRPRSAQELASAAHRHHRLPERARAHRGRTAHPRRPARRSCGRAAASCSRAGARAAVRLARRAPPSLPPLREARAREEDPRRRLHPRGLPLPEPARASSAGRSTAGCPPPRAAAQPALALQARPAPAALRGDEPSVAGSVAPRDRAETDGGCVDTRVVLEGRSPKDLWNHPASARRPRRITIFRSLGELSHDSASGQDRREHPHIQEGGTWKKTRPVPSAWSIASSNRISSRRGRVGTAQPGWDACSSGKARRAMCSRPRSASRRAGR